MRGLFAFLIKYHFFILLFVLQAISFVLIVSYNSIQRDVFISTSSTLTGGLENEVNDISEYLSLKEENTKLHKENARLKNALYRNYRNTNVTRHTHSDTALQQLYTYLPCKVIQSSVFKTRNYLTINAGANQGVQKMDAVLSSDGVVGVVKNVGEDYSVVLPIINTDFSISCRIGHQGYCGSMTWEGGDYKSSKLNDIPMHIKPSKGDSLFTTGYSLVFPTDEFVGLIKDVQKKDGESFFDIDASIAVDFKKIQSVYVVSNLFKGSLDSLKVEDND